MVRIEKSRNNREGKVRITFSMHTMDGCDCLYLVARFVPRHESTYRMERAADGTWALTLELDLGHGFQYCFRTNNGEWLQDPSAPDARFDSGPKSPMATQQM